MIRIPHLETNITVACQLSCVSCNHFVALQRNTAKATMAHPRQLETDLAWLVKAGLRVDAWGALGGEPTLHPQLVEFLAVAKASGIAGVIELWTNGLSLDRQPQTLWTSGVMDMLVLSAYPGTLDDERIAMIRGKCEQHGIRFRINDERNMPNFENLLEKTPTEGTATKIKYDACFFKNFSRVVDNGYFYRCCTSPFIPSLLMGLPKATDGLRVEGVTERMLREFLSQDIPAVSCSRCAGLNPSARRMTPWREERNPQAWEQESMT